MLRSAATMSLKRFSDASMCRGHAVAFAAVIHDVIMDESEEVK